MLISAWSTMISTKSAKTSLSVVPSAKLMIPMSRLHELNSAPAKFAHA